jgi:CRP/FNR family transcriptional regulator, cyclic AMP receptor protein
MSKVSLLRQIGFFSGLSDSELEAVADQLGKRTFGRGVILFHRGSPGDTLYIIESGKVRIFILSESGQEMSVRVCGTGEIFGELSMLDGLPRSAGAVAVEETHVLTLQREDFLELFDVYPRLAPGIIATLTARVRYTTQYAENLAFLNVEGRLASRLLELAEQYGVQTPAGMELALQLTQGDLASLVGATRERVNKVLGAFRDQGLIELDGQRLLVRDRRGLKRRIAY